MPLLKASPLLQRLYTLVIRRCLHSDASPLAGIRVLDMSRIVAGPFCTMTLGDLGADVIKLERPGRGDESRHWGPPFVQSGDSTYFLAVNRNKRSVCVDFSTERGRKLTLDLAAKSDVLVENFVPGKLDALGLGYEAVKRVNPRLVYCSVTGYGTKGPDAGRPGYDVVAASEGGLLSVTGPSDGEPCKVGVAMTDIATGLYAQGAVLAALIARTATGRGQQVVCSLHATQLACLINLASGYLNAGREPQPLGSAHENLVPYEAFPTADGHLTVGAGSDAHFAALCARLDLAVVADDPRFRSNADRVANRAVLVAQLRARLATRTTAHWLLAFRGAPFPHGPVNTVAQALDSPTGKAQLVAFGGVRLVGPAVEFSESENRARLAPPTLGQHTFEVLEQLLGLSRKQVQQLAEEGVIQ